MERRRFFKLFGMGVAGIALDQAIPFNRVWSFPTQIVVPKKPKCWLEKGDIISVNGMGPFVILQDVQSDDDSIPLYAPNHGRNFVGPDSYFAYHRPDPRAKRQLSGETIARIMNEVALRHINSLTPLADL